MTTKDPNGKDVIVTMLNTRTTITAHEIDKRDLRHAEKTGDFELAHMVHKRLRLEVVLNGPLIREAERVMRATRNAA